MHPENKMAAAIGGCMLSLVFAGIAASFGVAWLIVGRASAAFWLIGFGAGPIAGLAILLAVFPDMGRMWAARMFPPSFVFHLPTGFKGRFYIVGQDHGLDVARERGEFRFDIPDRRVLRVKRFKGLDNSFVKIRALRDGAPAPVLRDGQGMSSSPETGRLDYLSFYAGSQEELLRDNPAAVDLAEQIRRVEAGERP